MTYAEYMALTVGRDIKCAFDALNRDLSGNFVRRQRFACQENQAHDLEVVGLEERGRPLRRETAAAKRLDVNGLTWKCVCDGHGSEYARGGLCTTPTN